jgi:transposase InsO family protein
MKVISRILGASHLARLDVELSKDASKRLGWFDHYQSHGGNARLTCRYFGISPQTFYRWKRRYNPKHLESLEDHSHRPRHVRQPTAPPELVEAVFRLREEHPRWGKEKLASLLRGEGCQVSSSMVGRTIHRLRERGVLKEPTLNYVSAGKRQRLRPYAQRKPKDYEAKQMGDLVQLDTLDIRPLPGVVLKHFTAHDVISRWNVIGVYPRSTAANAVNFLNTLEQRMPFPLRAIQVDGGAEFEALFEEECQRRGIRLFVLPPRSPKLNGGVERAHRTHTEEFYEVTDSTFEIAELGKELLEWERVYNTVRPHQALGYLTPLKFLEKHRRTEGGRVSLII